MMERCTPRCTAWKRGLIEAEWGVAETGRRAVLRAHARGQIEMARETKAWTSYVEAVFKILQAAEA
jgi:hypothetical protein